MIASGVENRVAGAEAGGHSDIYGVEKCVELYDAAIAPVVPAVAALLDSFQTAFLDLPIDEATEESGVRHKRQFIDVGCGPGSPSWPGVQVISWCLVKGLTDVLGNSTFQEVSTRVWRVCDHMSALALRLVMPNGNGHGCGLRGRWCFGSYRSSE
ncbi:hypothetical protein V5799_020552 [Amblyomma americanum]|uniref:Uncharacterized protein n=1 Tax=Amblyomma americanum TaxID=6943 RepID=A0AAQ4ETS3_AMBAM